MFELRPYQKDAVDAVAAGYRRGLRRMLLQHATGSGKTCVAASIISGAHTKGNRALFLAHRDELISQTVDKLGMVAPELVGDIGIVKAERDEHEQPIVVASVQTLGRPDRLARLQERFAVVFADEAHRSAADQWQRVLHGVGCFEADAPLTVGITATAFRTDAKALGDTWQEVVHEFNILDGMRQGFLVDIRGIAVTLEALDLSTAKLSRGDFVDSDTAERLMEAEAPQHVYKAWNVHAAERKTIIFTPTIQLAHEMADTFQRGGVKAMPLSGNTPLDERRQLLKDFSSGRVQVIANAQVLVEGFDEPSCDCIVIARPTRSPVLYSQMIGRGTRIYPGKTDLLVIDTVGATERLDLLTVPKLFGLGAEANVDKEKSILQLAFQREEKQVRQGKIKVREVSLFGRQSFNWLAVRPGMWVLKLQEETLELQVDQGSGAWMFATRQTGEGIPPNRMLHRTGMTLELAMGVAEEYARRSPNFVNTLVSKNAGWRGRPPTEGQLAAAVKWGIRQDLSGLTRGEVNDMIDIVAARKRR